MTHGNKTSHHWTHLSLSGFWPEPHFACSWKERLAGRIRLGQLWSLPISATCEGQHLADGGVYLASRSGYFFPGELWLGGCFYVFISITDTSLLLLCVLRASPICP